MARESNGSLSCTSLSASFRPACATRAPASSRSLFQTKRDQGTVVHDKNNPFTKCILLHDTPEERASCSRYAP